MTVFGSKKLTSALVAALSAVFCAFIASAVMHDATHGRSVCLQTGPGTPENSLLSHYTRTAVDSSRS